jgi:hypothetical protein
LKGKTKMISELLKLVTHLKLKGVAQVLQRELQRAEKEGLSHLPPRRDFTVSFWQRTNTEESAASSGALNHAEGVTRVGMDPSELSL